MESEFTCKRKWLNSIAIVTLKNTELLTLINIKPVLVNRDTLL
jgi:hypothetical protein